MFGTDGAAGSLGAGLGQMEAMVKESWEEGKESWKSVEESWKSVDKAVTGAASAVGDLF